MFNIGDQFTYTSTITRSDIDLFADVSTDNNPIHVNEDYAQQTLFGGCVSHGILSVSRISALLGTKIVNPDTHYLLYLEQSSKFRLPVYPEDEITIVAVVTSWNEDKNILKLKTDVYNQHRKIVIEGMAVVMVKELNK